MTSADANTRDRHKGTILAAICLAALVLPLSFSGGAVATPAIGRDLGGSAAALNWITNAFMLSFGSTLMAAGTVADLYGRKRIFIIGVAAFVVVSVALSLAPSVAVLSLLRAAQGLAAAAALSGGTAALAQEFEGHARTRAFSLLGTTFGVGLALGPVLAGFLIESFGWRSIFLSATGVGLLALVLSAPRLRESRDPQAVGLDWPGIVTFTGALSFFTFAVIQAPDSGWRDPLVIGSLAAAALALIAFIIVETRIARPMLDLSLFRYPRFIGVQVLPIATCYCYVVLLVLLPLRFIGVEGYSEIDAGTLMIALSAPMLVVPFVAATLARRIPAGIISAVGLVIAAFGLLWLGRIGPSAPHFAAMVPMLVIGLGTGLPWGLMDGLSVSVVPKERAGMATGIFSTTRVAGEGIALAIVAALLAGFMQTSLRGELNGSAPTAFAPINEAAHRLATGDLATALSLLPGTTRAMLSDSYGDAFRELLHVLTAITLLSALAAFACLGCQIRPRSVSKPGDSPATALAPDQGRP
jgi:MFS family permease